jgi:hypothetical protein
MRTGVGEWGPKCAGEGMRTGVGECGPKCAGATGRFGSGTRGSARCAGVSAIGGAGPITGGTGRISIFRS